MHNAKKESPALVLGQRLNKLLRYRPDASIHQFLAFQLRGSQVIYSTDKAVFITSTSQFFGEMADWTELSDDEVARLRPAAELPEGVSLTNYEPRLPELPGQMAGNFAKMFETLTFAIEQTKNSKEFVEQAKTINGLVQSGINLGRLQVDAHKLLLGK